MDQSSFEGAARAASGQNPNVGNSPMSNLASNFVPQLVTGEIPPKRSAGRRYKGSRRSVSIAPTREPRRDAGPTAVARPVNKAPAEGQ